MIERARQIFWKLASLAGPLAISLAQFVLTFALLRRMTLPEFGKIAFLLIVYQFLLGCWGALFCAPLLVAFRDGAGSQADEHHPREQALHAGNLLGAMLVAVIMPVLAWRVGLDLGAAGLFGLYCALMMVRQYGRNHGLLRGARGAVTGSDLSFAAVVAGLAIFCLWWSDATPRLVCAGLAGGALVALLVLMARRGGMGWLPGGSPALQAYGAIWRSDARWSLLGVLTTEMTVNAHSYLITFLLGPEAFAPIAAAALVVRPVVVVINPLAEFERVHIARALAQGDRRGAVHHRDLARQTGLIVWIGAAALIIAAAWLVPYARLGIDIPPQVLSLASVLWFGVVLARVIYIPDSAVLIAAGRFRALAGMTLWTSAVSLLAVALLCWWQGAVWSLAGVWLGESLYALLLHRQTSRFLKLEANASQSVPA